MTNLLFKEMEMLMEEDGRIIHQFYSELRQCMGEEDQQMFDIFFKNMMENRESKVSSIKDKIHSQSSVIA